MITCHHCKRELTGAGGGPVRIQQIEILDADEPDAAEPAAGPEPR